MPLNGVHRGHGTPLHAAAFNGRHSVAELLLEKGAKVDIQDANCQELRVKTVNKHFQSGCQGMRLHAFQSFSIMVRNHEQASFIDFRKGNPVFSVGLPLVLEVVCRFIGLPALAIAP